MGVRVRGRAGGQHGRTSQGAGRGATWAYESGGGQGGNMGVRVRRRAGGQHGRTSQGAGRGATALPNSGKTVGTIWAKQEECVKFRANQPLCPP